MRRPQVRSARCRRTAGDGQVGVIAILLAVCCIASGTTPRDNLEADERQPIVSREIMIPALGRLTSSERQLTDATHGHILTNTGVWSADGQWVVYDVRSDPAGSQFDGVRIERVHVRTGEVQRLFVARDGAACGVVTASPVDDRIVFIHGPEHPTRDWSYAAWHRRGVLLHADAPADR